MKTFRIFALPLLAFIIGLGAGAYGFRLYLGAQTFDTLGAQAQGVQSALIVDHSPLQALLNAHLVTDTPDGIYRFDYRAAQADSQTLEAYLAGLQSLDPGLLAADEALAYWLNFYNAGMIQLVLAQGHETGTYGSVIDARGYYFLTQHFEVAGQALSLDQIENQVIRVQWDEPRIHYGLNCASLSCPNLAPAVFTGAELEAQLDRAARAYINHPRGVAGVERGRLVVSEIFRWFEDDFGGNDAGILDHIRHHAEPRLAAVLDEARRVSVQTYDWDLNIAQN